MYERYVKLHVSSSSRIEFARELSHWGLSFRIPCSRLSLAQDHQCYIKIIPMLCRKNSTFLFSSSFGSTVNLLIKILTRTPPPSVLESQSDHIHRCFSQHVI